MVQLSASVAPRPTADCPPARAIVRSSTTSVDGKPAAVEALLPQALGTPAARQMLAQSPCAVKSRCTEGSHTKPTRIEPIVSARTETTLHRNQGLDQAATPCTLVLIGCRSARPV